MQPITGGAHVPRAVLATAAEFGDVPRSIAEYIWNSFQYKRDKTAPAVVTIRFGRSGSERWFEVEDFPNGAGMDLAGLQRFFTMHAPNEDRLKGEAGRGQYGTGKAAAFGVGSELIVYSVRSGIANEIRLSKEKLLALASTYPCDYLPLEHTIVEQPVPNGSERNGTRVRVTGINSLFDEQNVVRNTIRIFMRVLDFNELLWEQKPGRTVRLIRQKPTTVLERKYQNSPETSGLIGAVTLHLSATEYDLPKQESGVVITTVGGSVLESNYINVSKRRTVVDKRILGEIDVPLLDTPDRLGLPATTQARRLEMNRESERVQALLTWIDRCLDDFREAVEQMLSSAVAEEDRAVLGAISGAFEHVLNAQYQKFMRDYSARMNLPKVSALAPFAGTGATAGGAPTDNGSGGSVFVSSPEGDSRVLPDETGPLELATAGRNLGTGGTAPGTQGTVKAKEDPAGAPASEKRRGEKKARGGRSLRVAYLGLGPPSPRAYFDGEGTFTINKDHPDFRGLETRDTEFMRRSAEAIAVVYAESVVELRISDGDPTVSQSKDALNVYLDEHDKVLRPLIEVCPEV